MQQRALLQVTAWQREQVLLEHYASSPGSLEPLPFHAHAEYQFALSLNAVGEYRYRTYRQTIPVGTLSVVHPGELHAPSDQPRFDSPAGYFMSYVDPHLLLQSAQQISGLALKQLPEWKENLLCDEHLIGLFLQMFPSRHQPATSLLQGCTEAAFLRLLISRYASNVPLQPAFRLDSRVLRRALEFLHAHYLENPSLKDLAHAAEASTVYVCRIFAKSLGTSPYRYQMHLRLDHAKKLLLKDRPLSEVSGLVGFHDQSHFGRFFKRYTGVTPHAYQSRKFTFLLSDSE